MFEIEKNFNSTKEQEEKLLQGADFIGTKVFTDVYYDSTNYDLTKRDWWLRAREGKFEMKIPIGNTGSGDRYNEIENDDEIKGFLGFNKNGNLKDLLEKNHYFSFCVCKTTRRKYKKEGFSIDIDFTEFDDGFIFEQMEVELMIEDESKAEETAQKIVNFAKPYGLHEVNMGKVSSYLKTKRPEHYKVLKDLGFWPEK